MLIKINRVVSSSLKSIKSSQCGQVAVILILVTAIALIFYAVTLNLGRVNQVKTLTTIASNTAASFLGSQMASYGEALLQTSLGGDRKVCGWTGIFAAIIAFILIIIAIILAPFTGGASLQLIVFITLVVAATVLNLVLQITYVQPKITELWNKIQGENLSTRNQFLETGIQSALQGVVTDNINVPDLTDIDLDRRFGFDAEEKPVDEIPRFAFYYTERLKTILPNDSTSIEDFLNALNDFLYKTTAASLNAEFGLYDKVDCSAPSDFCYDYTTLGLATSGNPFPSEANPCCVPAAYRDSCCTLPVGNPEKCGDPSICTAQSPYGPPDRLGNRYENVFGYDGYWPEDSKNGTFSLREELGRDDEHRRYRKPAPPADPNSIPQTVELAAATDKFHLHDVTAYYINPPNPGTVIPDYKRGIFQFFHKVSEWGVDLTNLDITFTTFPEHCHWADERNPAVPNCTTIPNYTHHAELGQLSLPIYPPSPPLLFNTTDYVDGANINPGYPPLKPDNITIPPNIIADDDVCAQHSLYPVVTPDGFWKSGGDRFCNTTWPYFSGCTKHGGVDACQDPESGDPEECECGDANAGPNNLWPDDVMDDLVYGLPDFFEWAEALLAQDPQDLAEDIDLWYDDAARWIEPGPATGTPPSVTPPDLCYTCDTTKPGDLYIWRDEIREMATRIFRWKKQTSFAGASCFDAWCVPDPACTLPPAEEMATFDDGTGVYGDLQDVVNCLTWNIEDTERVTVTVSMSPKVVGTVNVKGNYEKFDICGKHCSQGTCDNLPRSLIPTTAPFNYDPTAFLAPAIPGRQDDIWVMLRCYDQCSNRFCQDMPPAGGGYTWTTDPSLFNEAVHCAGGEPVAPWKNEIRNNLIVANPFCNLYVNGWLFKTRQSALEANNQVEKFKKRRNFLRNRLAELDYILTNVFTPAYVGFNNFLTCQDKDLDGEPDGPACKLIKARIENRIDPGLPYHVIYGWQDEPKQGQARGTWHAARVDARIPGRCDRDCAQANTPGVVDGDPRWPRIKTYTKSWGTKRCYELSDTEGIVKVRVTRFDEDTTGGLITFPNGMPIWDFRYFHPDKGAVSGNLGTLLSYNSITNSYAGTCRFHVKLDPSTGLPPSQEGIYKGAFILNDAPLDPSVDRCWDRMVNILSRGVVSETCAKYYFASNSAGMTMKFVPCHEI